MPKMKIAVVPKPGADFEIEEREIPTPGEGQVRIKVQACGVCFSDHIVKDGLMPWIQYPRSPGHEVAGVIDEVGPQRHRLEKRTASRRRLARRPRLHLPAMPSRRFHQLRQ